MTKAQYVFIIIGIIILLIAGVFWWQKDWVLSVFNGQKQIEMPEEMGQAIPTGMPEQYLYDRNKIETINMGVRNEHPNGLVDYSAFLVINEEAGKVREYYQNIFKSEGWDEAVVSEAEKLTLPEGLERMRAFKGEQILVIDLRPVDKLSTELAIRYEERKIAQ